MKLWIVLACMFLLNAPLQAAERAINKEVVIRATQEQAWAAWTTREGITSFFAPDARIEARVGGAFEIYFDPGAAAGAKGADDMRFMALQQRLERAAIAAAGAGAADLCRGALGTGGSRGHPGDTAPHRLGRRRRVGQGLQLL
jgi:Activator of Hsp90 ATPase homolog 1-like protein